MKKPISRFLGLTILLFHTIGTVAQDVQFSQYNNTPTLVNPAFVGSYSNAQIIFNYRTQWKSLDQKFNTPFLTAIVPISNKSGMRKGGLGISAISDKAGGNFFYQNTGVSLNLAYNVYLKKKTNLSFGAGTGYFQRRLSGDALTTGSQYVPNSGFDPTISTGEDLNNLSTNYLDIQSGVLLYGMDSTLSRRKFYIGAAGYHLTQPNLSFSAGEDKLPVKIVSSAGYMIVSKPKFSITPEILYVRQNHLQNFIGGAYFSYYFQENNSKLLGNGSIDFIPRYSTANAIILALQINKDFFSFGFSYDINAGGISRYNGNKGAAEVMLALRLPSKKKAKTPDEDYSVGQVREYIYKREGEEKAEDNTKGYKFNLEEVVNFEFNDTTLSVKAKQQLTDIANLLKGNKFLKVKITGYSDNLGTEKANRKISEERAKVCMEYLLLNGIDKSRITTLGEGSGNAVASNSNEEGRAKNRRVEFMIYK